MTNMNNKYLDIFNQLWNHAENEIVEFKKAEHSFDIDELGKYFSALSNEANLRERECGWIVFGVWDKQHEIVGTSFKEGEMAVNKLKQDMSQHTTDNLIFRDIVPIEVEGKRVLLFQVPASPRNIVMHWKGIAYGRDGESLKPLNQAKQDAIRQQPPVPDWSAGLVPNATVEDLDELALAKARIEFKKVHSSNISASEVDAWSDEDFLSHSMMMRDGRKIYTEQRNRFFPMPDYDIDNEHRTVGVTIYGKMIDEKYTELLKSNTTLSLHECLWLDAIQKHRPITKEAAKVLHEKKLVEGRYPNLTISLAVAKATKQLGHYTKEHGLAKDAIVKLTLQLAHNAGSQGFKRMDAFETLEHALSVSDSKNTKLRFIGRLLASLGGKGLLKRDGHGKNWFITALGEQELRLKP